MEKITLHRLLQELECYLQDDIGELMAEGYRDEPGTTLNNLHKLLDACLKWQSEVKDKL